MKLVKSLLTASRLKCIYLIEYRLASLNKFANQEVANSLKNDLNTADDSKRTLTKIDNLSANQLFSIFELKDPNCDKNNDGFVTGDELGCLSKIRKNFVPPNPPTA